MCQDGTPIDAGPEVGFEEMWSYGALLALRSPRRGFLDREDKALMGSRITSALLTTRLEPSLSLLTTCLRTWVPRRDLALTFYSKYIFAETG
jgi:hypothetical protein